jgi:hypothetical protein
MTSILTLYTTYDPRREFKRHTDALTAPNQAILSPAIESNITNIIDAH